MNPTKRPVSPARSPRSSSSRALGAVPRSPWGWALGGALAGLLPALVVFAPAQWLATGLDKATGGQLLLSEARGTVWNGSAQLVLTGGTASQDRTALPGRMQWTLRPTFDGARAQVQADCCTAQPLQVRLALGLSRFQVTVGDGQSRWPAALLAGLGTPWNTLQPQGQLVLQTQGLQAAWQAGRMVLDGKVQLDALDMSSRLSTLRPMGSYRLAVQGGEVPTLNLSTLNGHLNLSGTGQWVGQRLRFAGEASAAPDREAALTNLLNIIGRRNGARSLINVG